MLRLLSTIRKELLILLRDKAGLATLFLMPTAMVIIMALIQDAPFRDYQELKIPLLLVNNDTSIVGKTIEADLKGSKIVEVNTLTLSESAAKQIIASGKYEIGITIPADATQKLNAKVNGFVSTTLAGIGLSDSTKTATKPTDTALNIIIYFAPGTKKSFRSSILSSLKQFSSKLETQTLLAFFKKKLNRSEATDTTTNTEQIADFVNFQEEDASGRKDEKFELNSVQHNVPAWTIFGMFFIVISLAGSVIKERGDGSYLRILTMPGSYVTVLSGKITAYLFICMIQCVLMLLIGIYFLPVLGLPTLVIGSSTMAITLIAVCTGLAATGYGVVVGTLFNTHQQASTFGSVSVVILAALGGIWVPVYVMPNSIRMLAEFSPLYWSLSAFQNIFLGNGNVQVVLPHAFKLVLFFISTIGIAYFYNKAKRQ